MRSFRNKAVATTALLLLVVMARPASAQVKPGDFITPDNAATVRDLLSPGAYQQVLRGMTMKIVPPSTVEWPPPYKDATEKYSAQVKLSSDHRSLVGYVAGQPFPLIEPNDPDIAVKIVWNNVFRPIASDDFDLRYYECELVKTGRNLSNWVINRIVVGHYANYNYVGRTEVEPIPIDPTFRESGRYYASALYPIIAPEQLRGYAWLHYRYAGPSKADDFWEWLPGARRLRRFNETAQQISALANTWDGNNNYGFGPKPENYNYRFLGEKTMLACVHASSVPELKCDTDGGGSACPELWEPRHVYIVEATPRPEKLAQNMETKIIFYTDSETWFPPFTDGYAPDGQLYRTHIYWLTYRDRPVPDARVAIYPFKREFVVGATAIDNLNNLSEMCWWPGRTAPERECWYINMGAVDKEFFTLAAAVRKAQ